MWWFLGSSSDERFKRNRRFLWESDVSLLALSPTVAWPDAMNKCISWLQSTFWWVLDWQFYPLPTTTTTIHPHCHHTDSLMTLGLQSFSINSLKNGFLWMHQIVHSHSKGVWLSREGADWCYSLRIMSSMGREIIGLHRPEEWWENILTYLSLVGVPVNHW